MDVSSLLNAPDLEDDGKDNFTPTSRLTSEKHSSSPFPAPVADPISVQGNTLPLTDAHVVRNHESQSFKASSSPFERKPAIAAVTRHHSGLEDEGLRTPKQEVALHGKPSSDGKGLPLMELRELELESRLGKPDNSHKIYPMGTSYTRRRFSESQSSLSSYTSSASEIHSRKTSVTTIGGDNSVQSEFPEDLTEETRLATVQEETFMRFLGSEHSRDHPRRHGTFPHESAGAQISNTNAALCQGQRSDATLDDRDCGTRRCWPAPTTRLVYL